MLDKIETWIKKSKKSLLLFWCTYMVLIGVACTFALMSDLLSWNDAPWFIVAIRATGIMHFIGGAIMFFRLVGDVLGVEW